MQGVLGPALQLTDNQRSHSKFLLPGGGGCGGGFLYVRVGCQPRYPSWVTARERCQKEASNFSGLTARGLEKGVPSKSVQSPLKLDGL